MSVDAIDWRERVRRSRPQIIAGAIIGIAALFLAFRRVEWSGVSAALRQTRPSMIVVALLLVCVTLAVNTTRWWLLFAPEHRERNWFVLAAGILIGQTVNVAIPARLGELARMVLVGTRERVSKTRVGATIVVEKVTDIAVFAVCVGFLLIEMTLPSWMTRSGTALAITAAALVSAILILTFWSRSLLRLVEIIARRFPDRWSARLIAFSEAALSGLRSLRDWRAGLAIWILAVAVLFFSISVNYVLFAALGLPLSPVAAVFLTAVLRVGEAPPSLPGKVGLFQYLVIIALAAFGVDRTSALTYSLVLYAVAVIPVLIAGVACMFAFRWSS
ncbi:MAG TPA: lysylphosphatidylglycerol synthase transmembrane domain-containing protein, partial [Thermoanaerobaculia bacterium]